MTDTGRTKRFGSVCSGIDAPSVAWSSLGWKPAFVSEIERFPREVLAARDAIFLVLAVIGWRQWGRRTDQYPISNTQHPISK